MSSGDIPLRSPKVFSPKVGTLSYIVDSRVHLERVEVRTGFNINVLTLARVTYRNGISSKRGGGRHGHGYFFKRCGSKVADSWTIYIIVFLSQIPRAFSDAPTFEPRPQQQPLLSSQSKETVHDRLGRPFIYISSQKIMMMRIFSSDLTINLTKTLAGNSFWIK